MQQKESAPSTEQIEKSSAKKINASKTIDAFFIGFLIGIIIYSVVENTWGLLTLIPLYMIYGLLKKSQRNN
jgi:F0F1-type ATP synthase assembly protein I